jgi:hypothetical protein
VAPRASWVLWDGLRGRLKYLCITTDTYATLIYKKKLPRFLDLEEWRVTCTRRLSDGSCLAKLPNTNVDTLRPNCQPHDTSPLLSPSERSNPHRNGRANTGSDPGRRRGSNCMLLFPLQSRSSLWLTHIQGLRRPEAGRVSCHRFAERCWSKISLI